MILNDKAEVYPGITFRREDYEGNGDVLVITPRNLQVNNKLTLEESKTVYLNQQIQHKLLKPGDIIISCNGPIHSICNIYQFDLPIKAVVSIHLAIIRPRNNHNKLWEILNKNYYKLKLIAKDIHFHKRLSLHDLRNFELCEI